MKRIGLALALVAVIGAAIVAWRFSNETPSIPAHRIAKGVFEDQVTTNGRVEPSEWASARAEREGLVISVPVAKGQRVAKDAVLAVLDTREAQADLDTANARIEEAKATIQLLEGGGRKREIVEIEQGVRQRRAEVAQTQKDLAVADRLLSRNAGTSEEVRQLKDKLELLNLQIAALEARRPTLVAPVDLASAQARLREATAAASLARRRMELSTVRAPLAGVVYQLDAKPGAYLMPGLLVANVGNIDSLKVLVYVDEPELGRVSKGMPVSITWDAMEGKRWEGTIEKIPTQIVPLGTRQVGELECRIENRDQSLLPGTNVNAFIQTRKMESVLLAPKEAIRTIDGVTGVYVIENGTLAWRKIETGAASVSNAVVLSGLQAGDLVALGPETQLKPGAKVTTVLQ
jgi:HlyD family secretion protein